MKNRIILILISTTENLFESISLPIKYNSNISIEPTLNICKPLLECPQCEIIAEQIVAHANLLFFSSIKHQTSIPAAAKRALQLVYHLDFRYNRLGIDHFC